MNFNPDNEIAKARRAKYRKVRIKRILISVAVIVGIVSVLLSVSLYSSVVSSDIRDFFKAYLSIGSYPVKIGTGVISEAVVSSRTLFLLNDTSVKTVSGSGANLLDYTHGISNPGLAVNSNRAVVFSRGGKSYKVFNRTMHLFSGNMEDLIIDVAVSNNGQYAFLTSGDVYTSELTVYSRNGEKQFVWYGADGFPVGVYPSSNRNELAVLCVSARDGVLYSIVTMIDLDTKKEKTAFTLEGMPVIAFPDSDGIVIFMDDHCVRCSNNGTVTATIDYNGKEILDIRSDSNKDIAVAFGDNRKSEINNVMIVTRKLSLSAEIDYRDEIDEIWINNDRLFILNRDRIDSYSHSGELKEIYHSDFSVYSMVYFGGLVTVKPQFLEKLSRNSREEIG